MKIKILEPRDRSKEFCRISMTLGDGLKYKTIPVDAKFVLTLLNYPSSTVRKAYATTFPSNLRHNKLLQNILIKKGVSVWLRENLQSFFRFSIGTASFSLVPVPNSLLDQERFLNAMLASQQDNEFPPPPPLTPNLDALFHPQLYLSTIKTWRLYIPEFLMKFTRISFASKFYYFEKEMEFKQGIDLEWTYDQLRPVSVFEANSRTPSTHSFHGADSLCFPHKLPPHISGSDFDFYIQRTMNEVIEVWKTINLDSPVNSSPSAFPSLSRFVAALTDDAPLEKINEEAPQGWTIKSITEEGKRFRRLK